MTDWQAAQKQSRKTAKWACTMTKVRIRKTIARTKWQLITFVGPEGGESVGIVDMVLAPGTVAECSEVRRICP
jgi:hypothetical protein